VQPDRGRYENSIGKGIIHSLQAFREQMEILARHYAPVTMDDLLGFVSEQKEIPPKSVAVTFDDGFADNYEFALPVLAHAGIPASFYIAVGSIEAAFPPWYCRLRHAYAVTQAQHWRDSVEGRVHELSEPDKRYAAFLTGSRRCAQLAGLRQEDCLRLIEEDLEVERLTSRDCPMMTWTQVRSLRSMGHIVGSHTVTHPNLAHVTTEALETELKESKRQLEARLGEPVVHFSYPSPILEPHYTEQSITATNQAGYLTAVTCTPGPVRAGDNPLVLRRVSAPFERDEFRWMLGRALLNPRASDRGEA
jgi:peptidoglycan/xylan/chitin deacetylase (PgdA/CDA1 family)